MLEASDATAPHSEENLNEEDIYEILKGAGVPKNDSNKIKNECGAWYALLLYSVD